MAILTIVLGYLFKAIRLGVRIALSRVTIILAFAATIAGTVYAIWSGLTDNTSFVTTAINGVQSASFHIGEFVNSNEWLQVASYALSLDILLDGLLGTFFWVFVTLSTTLVVIFFSVFYALAPILADMIISGLKMQMLSKWNA